MPNKDSMLMTKFIGYNLFLDVSPSVRIQSENDVLLSSFRPNNKTFYTDNNIRLIQFLFNFPNIRIQSKNAMQLSGYWPNNEVIKTVQNTTFNLISHRIRRRFFSFKNVSLFGLKQVSYTAFLV